MEGLIIKAVDRDLGELHSVPGSTTYFPKNVLSINDMMYHITFPSI